MLHRKERHIMPVLLQDLSVGLLLLFLRLLVPTDPLLRLGLLVEVLDVTISTLSLPLPGIRLLDPVAPVSGTGSWYLFCPGCAAGSWQTEVGQQPARDSMLP